MKTKSIYRTSDQSPVDQNYKLTGLSFLGINYYPYRWEDAKSPSGNAFHPHSQEHETRKQNPRIYKIGIFVMLTERVR